MHSDWRFFCNIPGCTFSVSYLNRRNMMFGHAGLHHQGRYQGETLRKIGSHTNAGEFSSPSSYPTPSGLRSVPNLTANATTQLAPAPRFPAHADVPDAYVTTFSTLSDALVPKPPTGKQQ
ncbi:hypothetical protein CYLTODRAFT_453436 [Cylindrobasidium torrendii FP15055 ss-10]|uniref:Uncharacterized protein n=1 Tax=Cylindrobasidium torrendii FP15055 ss-10 TaxID=1314674 RepID=A0A0D7BEE3_9AGAR|nr:hypothetical protein CYLTODRAFT_453436 [Cylindrobasidium torrendii FP15055 ss-10]